MLSEILKTVGVIILVVVIVVLGVLHHIARRPKQWAQLMYLLGRDKPRSKKTYRTTLQSLILE
jgi:hypothetical protein